MNDNSFNSIDRLLEFGMSMAVANQMINTMNYAMSNMNIAGQSSILSPQFIQMYAAVDGKQVGPFSDSEMQILINNGTVTENTLIWHSGMTAWKYAKDVPLISKFLLLLKSEMS